MPGMIINSAAIRSVQKTDAGHGSEAGGPTDATLESGNSGSKRHSLGGAVVLQPLDRREGSSRIKRTAFLFREHTFLDE